MALVHNPAVYPPDGYYFMQGNVRIQAGTPALLAVGLKNYRVAHQIPIGNPIQEINDFTCARYPTGCRETNQKFQMPEPKKQVQMPGSIALTTGKWLTDLYRALSSASGTLLVGQVEADRRAAICASCPRQTGWGTGCGGCDASSKRLALAIRKGREAAHSGKLLACGVLREDTRTSVWIEGLRPADDSRLPANCWRRPKS